jgi:hypothetical protein
MRYLSDVPVETQRERKGEVEWWSGGVVERWSGGVME